MGGTDRDGSGGAAPARGIAGVAAADPGRVALVHDGRRITFEALHRSVNALAHTLHGAGVGPGARVALVMNNRPEFYAVWNAAARLGALMVPVSTRLTAPEMAYIVSDSGSAVVVHEAAGPATAAAAEAARTAGVPALAVDDPELATGRDDAPLPAYLETPALTMTYTSGTTGRPKGI
ncbi:MAG TPA: AMP-binding protein, partial [Acidimicrobiales bacterium]|nr:AMP-binding protein [Acidimicrobiales bacterium]